MKQISITHVPHLAGSKTPARCNRRTGQIWINDSVWPGIDPAHRVFILLHEYGHIMLNSSDELEVDAFASDLYVKMGYSLTESVKALSRVLTGANPQHIDRVESQLNRVKAIDILHNSKQKRDMVHLTEPTGMVTNFNGPAWYETNEFTEDLFGLGKKAQERKKARQEAKNYAKMKRADATVLRAESKKIKSEAKQTLADQGIVDSTEAGGVIKSAVSAIAGQGGGDPAAMSTAPAPEKGKKTMWIIVGSIAGLAAVGTVLYFIFKKKR